MVTKNSITVANLIATVGQLFRGRLKIGEVAYFVYDLPQEGFTLTVIVIEGYVVMYISTQVSNPDEASHDFKLVTDETVSVFIPPMSPSSEQVSDSPANDTVKVYMSIEGHSPLNLFVLNTTYNDTTGL